jgi:hypothetical protein
MNTFLPDIESRQVISVKKTFYTILISNIICAVDICVFELNKWQKIEVCDLTNSEFSTSNDIKINAVERIWRH